jgi:hypothetical protein
MELRSAMGHQNPCFSRWLDPGAIRDIRKPGLTFGWPPHRAEAFGGEPGLERPTPGSRDEICRAAGLTIGAAENAGRLADQRRRSSRSFWLIRKRAMLIGMTTITAPYTRLLRKLAREGVMALDRSSDSGDLRQHPPAPYDRSLPA